MTQKQLQKKSKYAEYDIDGDGIVSDEELSSMKDSRWYRQVTNRADRLVNRMMVVNIV